MKPDIFLTEGSETEAKPILVKSVDGGPDENPRFFNNIVMGCKTFYEMGLDCYIEVTNAPGLSAYNICERRMYHLSKEMTALVLPYETFGSHLNAGGDTIDEDLEKKNFKAAGEILKEVWSNLVIDSYPVMAEFIETPPSDKTKNYQVSSLFRSKHVFETRYMTVYLKCDDLGCCSKPRTSVASFFPGRRIPPLIPIHQTPHGPQAMELSPDIHKQIITFPSYITRIVMEKSLMPQALVEKFPKGVPYDVFFPTQQTNVEKQTCPNCGKYHASIKSLKLHKQICKKPKKKPAPASRLFIDTASDSSSDDEILDTRNDMDYDNIEEVIKSRTCCVAMSSGVEKILDLAEWIKLPWEPTID